MIDNLDIIKPILKFESEDDFYFLQILQRKKENPQLGNNSRVIRNYYINSIEYLDKRYDEIKSLCKTFNARAMIRLNKRSFYKVAFKSMQNIANTMANKDFTHIDKQYVKACGQSHNDTNKKWIIDIDHEVNGAILHKLCDSMFKSSPYEEHKHIAIIPSKNGFHLITKPFNINEFKIELGIHKWDYSIPDIHKDNPTNLFIN